MSRATYFIHTCPFCSRLLEVRVEYLGKSVMCQHCSGRFVAQDLSNSPRKMSDSGSQILERVDELLESTKPARESPR
jgi:hypothetical protein